MPIPEKRNTENEQEFLQRCMSDKVMTKEYPDKDQRYSICRNQIKGSK